MIFELTRLSQSIISAGMSNANFDAIAKSLSFQEDRLIKLNDSISGLLLKKVNGEKELTRAGEQTAQVSAQLQKVGAEVMRLEQTREAVKQRLAEEDSEQREVYLGLVTAERTASTAANTAQSESANFTKTMRDMNQAYILERQSFMGDVASVSPGDLGSPTERKRHKDRGQKMDKESASTI